MQEKLEKNLYQFPYKLVDTNLTRIYWNLEIWDTCNPFTVHSMALPVVEFSREGYKIRKVFG
jgi:hypothetical protein